MHAEQAVGCELDGFPEQSDGDREQDGENNAGVDVLAGLEPASVSNQQAEHEGQDTRYAVDYLVEKRNELVEIEVNPEELREEEKYQIRELETFGELDLEQPHNIEGKREDEAESCCADAAADEVAVCDQGGRKNARQYNEGNFDDEIYGSQFHVTPPFQALNY